MHHRIIAMIILFLPLLLLGQYGETIRTARPGQAIGAYTLGQKLIQIQTGFNYNSVNTGSDRSNSLTESTVIRIGVLNKLEVSGVIDFQTLKPSVNGMFDRIGGISATQLGWRINILENKGAIPTVGLQGRYLLRAQSAYFQRERLGTRFILATGNKITDWLSITTNWGVTVDGNSSGPKSLYVLNLSFSITDKIGTFVETYGSFNSFTANFDTGLSYLIHKDLQLDVSGGYQGRNNVKDWFIDFGCSWRFDWRKEGQVIPE